MGLNIDIPQKHYTPPSVKNIYFGTTCSGTVQVCSFGNMYIDATAASGVYVTFLRNTTKQKLYIHNTVESGITSSWVNNRYLFIGTTHTGINYICLNELINSGINLDYTYSTYNFASEPNITSNRVHYLHCSDNYLMCCTDSGVDCYDITTNSGYWYYTVKDGCKKCFVTNDSAYYTVKSGTYEAVVVIKDFYNSWDTPYKTFDNVSYFRLGISLNDIYVKTTASGSNIILVATTSGIYAINEDTGFYDLYLTES